MIFKNLLKKENKTVEDFYQNKELFKKMKTQIDAVKDSWRMDVLGQNAPTINHLFADKILMQGRLILNFFKNCSDTSKDYEAKRFFKEQCDDLEAHCLTLNNLLERGIKITIKNDDPIANIMNYIRIVKIIFPDCRLD